MRLYKLVQGTEFPERVNEDAVMYVNIRSIERVDVRPEECRYIQTGFRISCTDSERVYVVSEWGDTSELFNGDELVVLVSNTGKRNILIYPGSVIGKVVVEEDE